MAKEKPVTVNMTDAIALGPLDPKLMYLFAISKWAYGKTDKGNKVDVVFEVVKPEGIKGKVFDAINLENEYTKTRARDIMVATGVTTVEEMSENTSFEMPSEEEMLGRQFAARVRTQAGTDGYDDRSQLRKVLPESEYTEEDEE